MKKNIKKIMLGIISFIIVLTLFPIAALASENNFEPRLSAPSGSNPYYNRSLNVYSQQGYGMPNCTAYAYGRIYEITGEEPLIRSGNAGSWWFSNKRNNYYEYGAEPKLGAIACWSGHVAVVEEINENSVTVSESHWGGRYFNTKTYSSPYNSYQTFYGYIYASDSIFEVEEPTYSYTQEKSEFAEIPCNPFSNTELTIVNEPVLIMNSHMITNAIG